MADQAKAERAARLMDAITDQFASELGDVLSRLMTKVRVLARKLETDTTGRIVATQQNLALSLQLRADLQRALTESGFPEMALRAVDTTLDELAEVLLKPGTRTADAVSLGAFDVDALVALKELRLAQILNVGEEIATNLWRVLIDGVMGVRTTADLVQDVADMLEISARRARTVYDTIVSTYSRQVGQIGSTGEDDELFFYAGPVDGKVRPFCLELVGKVFMRAEIDDMDNEQLPNVMITGGGYNCRHIWQRVSNLDQELKSLHGTGKRQDGVQRRLEDSVLVTTGAAA